MLNHPLTAAALWAYLDPGAGSMLLQMLLAGIAGVGVICKLYWRRIGAMFDFSKSKGDDPANRT